MILSKRLGLLAALLVPLACALAQTGGDQIGAITSSLRAREFEKALQVVQSALERSPNNAQLWTLRGIALSGEGHRKEALVAFRRAISISPDYLPALEGAAQIEYETADKEVFKRLQHVLELRPDEPTSHAMLAVLNYKRGDCASAVQHFAQSGPLLDSQVGALHDYGICLVKLKQLDRATSVLERALSMTPADNRARCQLAAVQLMAEHPKDAIETLTPLLETNRGDSKVLQLAASAYEAAGDTPEAVRVLRQAILADPHNVDAYLDFANISIDHQSFQVGVDMVNAGIMAEPKAAPKAAPLYVARGILYVQLAEYDRAEADFEKADALDPRQSIGSAAEGLEAVQRNDPDRALATVQAKLAKKPNDAFLLYLRADILTQKGPDPGTAEFREAAESAKKAISIDPALVAARDVLAKLFLQSGQNQEAIEQCRKALSTNPKDQAALYHLIQALRKTGQKDAIPGLLKQLAEMRAESTKAEAEHNRYKLVNEESRSTEKDQR